MKTTIKQKKDFLKTEKDRIYTNSVTHIIVRNNNLNYYRYGIVIGKKKVKLAILRNRAKRLLRASLNNNKSLLINGYDYIFLLKRDVLKMKFIDIDQEIKKGLSEIV